MFNPTKCQHAWVDLDVKKHPCPPFPIFLPALLSFLKQDLKLQRRQKKISTSWKTDLLFI